jgi:catechol 2,3-dioxygenase-like lactoylglutathione lyase family enzyme
MLGRIHHVGYVARSRSDGVAVFIDKFGLSVVTEFELPQYRLRGAFLGGVDGLVEIVEFTDGRLADERLDGLQLRLDHVAHEVENVGTAAATLRAQGARTCGPDGSPLDDPVSIASGLHIWLVLDAAPGVRLQLVQPA